MLVWLLLGPGVQAMLGENDGPSMLSYAASGAMYGLGFFLPFIAVTFAAAYVVQEMSKRLGAVTHRGYGELIFQRLGPLWGWLSAGDLVATNLITLITEIIAIPRRDGIFRHFRPNRRRMRHRARRPERLWKPLFALGAADDGPRPVQPPVSGSGVARAALAGPHRRNAVDMDAASEGDRLPAARRRSLRNVFPSGLASAAIVLTK
jgi:hypothetical protein